jgi:hypothetical protein
MISAGHERNSQHEDAKTRRVLMFKTGIYSGFSLRLGTLALSCCLSPATAWAENWQFGGHVKYQYHYTDYLADDLNAILGHDPAQDHSADLRLKAEKYAGGWDFVAHYELLGIAGDTLEARRRLAALGLLSAGTATGLPDDRRRWFDLTDKVTDGRRTAAVQRLDRLSVGYHTGRQVLRFGRQAVSWGNGLVFQPLDFVNPFPPLAIDKDYKTGDDMLYGQALLGAGNDVQAMVVPRRHPATRELESDQSSAAAKFRSRWSGFDLDLLAARHYDENLAGIGVVKSLGGAVWRLDASYTDLKHDGGSVSFVTNLDYSWVWGGRNVYGFIEYFRNGAGATDRARYSAPDPALSARIARGELFTLARDYAALGLQIELTPLVNLYNNLIWNLNDASRVLQLRGLYDWRQNVQLIAGVNLPFGDRGDEYGGIPVATLPAYSASGRSVYVRAAYYF